MMIKLEEGKYYRTADGRKVGPVHIAETHIPDKWALWASDGKIYEVVGLPLEEALETKLLTEWTDEPKLWCDMTPEEKGALLLAKHEGEVIEWYIDGVWEVAEEPKFDNPRLAYRVKPGPRREEVEVYGKIDGEWEECWPGGGTHRITFDVVDGKPDCASIKMERIDD